MAADQIRHHKGLAIALQGVFDRVVPVPDIQQLTQGIATMDLSPGDYGDPR
jgi:hypothetical protein